MTPGTDSELAASVVSDGLGLNTVNLRGYLNPLIDGGLDGELTARLITGGRSNPTYELSDGSRSWVLRRPPHGLVLPTAHDMGREYRILTALRDTGVPVPATVGLSYDEEIIGAPFYVMQKLDGVTFRTHEQTAALTPAERRGFSDSMIHTLAALHNVDVAKVGLADWGKPDGFLERQLRRWHRQWDGAHTYERAEVDELLDRLTRSLPVTRFPGIVHGDYKVDNLMVDKFDAGKILGVLDWEMSTLGDTLADLGVMISFWDEPGDFFNPISAGTTAHEGFPTRDEAVQEYAQIRGIEIADIDWYIVFADFKIAVILEGIHTRYVQGHTVGDDFEGIGDMVGPLLNRALERASASSHHALRT